jgi:hypothetical protein
MSNLFKKAAVFTDIHFGLKSNSQIHNEDCLNFVKWATDLAVAQGCETCIFTGDWHNNRASINIVTLTYSLRALEYMNANFSAVHFIPGNHDLYYRDKRDIQSVEWAKHLQNVNICNDWTIGGDVVIAPWLVGDDHKRIPKLDAKYVFGHFELPHFFMNAKVAMPEHGELKRESFGGVEQVFSGHFHMRQNYKNITYLGNCFPHNYADAGDDDRGVMILDWGQPPVYHAWPEQPRYRVYNLSDVVDRPDDLLAKGMHVRLNLDMNLSYEEAGVIKEAFVSQYDLRELTLVPGRQDEHETGTVTGQIEFESVDTIVTNQLTNIESEHYDPNILLAIYQNL